MRHRWYDVGIERFISRDPEYLPMAVKYVLKYQKRSAELWVHPLVAGLGGKHIVVLGREEFHHSQSLIDLLRLNDGISLGHRELERVFQGGATLSIQAHMDLLINGRYQHLSSKVLEIRKADSTKPVSTEGTRETAVRRQSAGGSAAATACAWRREYRWPK